MNDAIIPILHCCYIEPTPLALLCAHMEKISSEQMHEWEWVIEHSRRA